MWRGRGAGGIWCIKWGEGSSRGGEGHMVYKVGGGEL